MSHPPLRRERSLLLSRHSLLYSGYRLLNRPVSIERWLYQSQPRGFPSGHALMVQHNMCSEVRHLTYPDIGLFYLMPYRLVLWGQKSAVPRETQMVPEGSSSIECTAVMKVREGYLMCGSSDGLDLPSFPNPEASVARAQQGKYFCRPVDAPRQGNVHGSKSGAVKP